MTPELKQRIAALDKFFATGDGYHNTLTLAADIQAVIRDLAAENERLQRERDMAREGLALFLAAFEKTVWSSWQTTAEFRYPVDVVQNAKQILAVLDAVKD